MDFLKFQFRKIIALAIWAIAMLLAIGLRYHFMSVECCDFEGYLQPWYDFVVQHGGFPALRYAFTNYAPPYTYWIVFAATALSGLPKIVAIKLLAVITDFVCAFLVYKIVKLKYPTNRIPLLAFLTVLFTPTVFINSSYWGQCDVIYTTGVLACFYFLLIRRELIAFICFGMAFSFKQQALFFVPFLLILLLKGKVSWKSFFWIPITYLVAILPAWLAGRSLQELLLVYAGQANQYRNLSSTAPNLYQSFSNDYYDIIAPAGLVLTVVVMGILIVRVWRSQVELTPDRMVQLALVSALLMPYFLPKMHDRYFFMADVLSIVFAFYFPRYFWIPIVVQLSSLFSYTFMLRGEPMVSLKVLAIALGIVVWFLIRLHNRTFHLKQAEPVATNLM